MSVNDRIQTEALDKLVRVVSLGSQVTILRRVCSMIEDVRNGVYTLDQIQEWAAKEIDLLEKARDES